MQIKNEYAVLAELADAHGSGPCGSPWGFASLRRHQRKLKFSDFNFFYAIGKGFEPVSFGLLPLRGIGRKTEILAGSVKRNRNVRLKRLLQLKRHFVQEIDAVFFVETLHCLVDDLFCFTIFTEKFAQTIHRHIIFLWDSSPCVSLGERSLVTSAFPVTILRIFFSRDGRLSLSCRTPKKLGIWYGRLSDSVPGTTKGHRET